VSDSQRWSSTETAAVTAPRAVTQRQGHRKLSVDQQQHQQQQQYDDLYNDVDDDISILAGASTHSKQSAMAVALPRPALNAGRKKHS
jgi:hypothetical protein